MKRILIILVSIAMVFFMPLRVFAADEEYKTFSQLDERWRYHQVHGTSYNIGSAGCFITSIAVLMAYANEDLRDVNAFSPATLADQLSFSGGGLVSSSCSNADSTFTKVADDDGSFSADEALQKVKGYMEQGYYVTIMSSSAPITNSTHFSPVVGIQDGKPVVWDVAGGAHSDWDAWANAGIVNIDVFASSKQKSLDAMSGSSSSVEENKPQNEEEQTAVEALIKESDLVGMPDKGKLKENQIPIIIPKSIELSITDNIRVSQIKDNIKNDKITISESFNSFLFFVGLACMAYAMLLLVALMLDYTNVFIEFSLLRLLTFGKYRLVSKEYFEENKLVGYDKKLKYTNVTPGMCIIRIIILVSLGGLIMSGVVQYLIVYLLNKVRGAF